MRAATLHALLILLILHLSGCERSPQDDVLTYTRQLKPGMTVKEVRSLFPEAMHWRDEAADETSQNCWMARRYTTNRVARCMTFYKPEAGWRSAEVYFDSAGRLVGLEFQASGGPQLQPSELRFPGELRFPAEQVGPNTKSAPAELYLRSAPSGATNRP